MTYDIHIKGSDALGFNFLRDIVAMANLGATMKVGVWPRLTFPHHARMVLESEVEPEATPHIRVFDGNGKEVRIKPLEVVKVEHSDGTFSMEVDPAIAVNPADGKRWSQDALEAMSWDEFKAVCKADGFGGRDRTKMQRTYLDK